MADILVIADTHITSNETWHTSLRTPGVSYHNPIARTSRVLAEMARAANTPSLVVHLGDVVHLEETASYRIFQNLFNERFPSTPLLVVAGNHDVTSAVRGELDLVRPTGQMQESDLLSSRLDLDGWNLFSIDANCGRQSNRRSTVEAVRMLNYQNLTLEWLKGELISLPDDAKVVIFTHFPIVALDRAISGYPPTEFGAAIAKLLRQYRDKIKLVVHGHIHHGVEYNDREAELDASRALPAISFRSTLCASYSLKQSEDPSRDSPIFDAREPFGYEMLQLPPIGPLTNTPRVVNSSLASS